MYISVSVSAQNDISLQPNEEEGSSKYVQCPNELYKQGIDKSDRDIDGKVGDDKVYCRSQKEVPFLSYVSSVTRRQGVCLACVRPVRR